MLAILLLGLHRGQKLSRGGQILSEKEEGEERDGQTVSSPVHPFPSIVPKERGGAGVHKRQRREDERVRTPFWTFVRRLSFWQTPTSDDDRQGGGRGAGSDTLLVVSVDKYNRQTDWRADSLLCSDCDGIGSWEMRSNLVRAPKQRYQYFIESNR